MENVDMLGTNPTVFAFPGGVILNKSLYLEAHNFPPIFKIKIVGTLQFPTIFDPKIAS